MAFLSTHAKGPRSGSGMVIVCTMADMVIGGAEAVAARGKAVREEVNTWGISRRMSRVEVVTMSNKTGEGLERVWSALWGMSRAIGTIKVPHAFKRAQVELVKHAAEVGKMFLTVEEIKNVGM